MKRRQTCLVLGQQCWEENIGIWFQGPSDILTGNPEWPYAIILGFPARLAAFPRVPSMSFAVEYKEERDAVVCPTAQPVQKLRLRRS